MAAVAVSIGKDRWSIVTMFRHLLCFLVLMGALFGLAWSASHLIRRRPSGVTSKRLARMVLTAENLPPETAREYPGLRQQLPHQAQLLELFRKKSVALVGNGNILLDQGLGKEIDSHDVVMRVNHFPPPFNIHPAVRGRDIGYKVNITAGAASSVATHTWAFSPKQELLLNKVAGVTMLFDCCERNFGLEFIYKNRIMNATTHSPVWYSSWQSEGGVMNGNGVHPDWGFAVPTTGYLCALFLRSLSMTEAENSIKSVTLYGFGGGGHIMNPKDRVKNHNWHNFDVEHEMFEQWQIASNGRFRVWKHPLDHSLKKFFKKVAAGQSTTTAAGARDEAGGSS